MPARSSRRRARRTCGDRRALARTDARLGRRPPRCQSVSRRPRAVPLTPTAPLRSDARRPCNPPSRSAPRSPTATATSSSSPARARARPRSSPVESRPCCAPPRTDHHRSSSATSSRSPSPSGTPSAAAAPAPAPSGTPSSPRGRTPASTSTPRRASPGRPRPRQARGLLRGRGTHRVARPARRPRVPRFHLHQWSTPSACCACPTRRSGRGSTMTAAGRFVVVALIARGA